MMLADFPDVLELVRVHLEQELGVSVSTRLPDRVTTAGHVRVTRSGGVRSLLVDDVLIDVEVWSAREARAEALAGDVVTVALSLVGGRLDGWQVLSTSNPGGVAALPDPRFPDVARVVAKIGLRVRGVSRKEQER